MGSIDNLRDEIDRERERDRKKNKIALEAKIREMKEPRPISFNGGPLDNTVEMVDNIQVCTQYRGRQAKPNELSSSVAMPIDSKRLAYYTVEGDQATFMSLANQYGVITEEPEMSTCTPTESMDEAALNTVNGVVIPDTYLGGDLTDEEYREYDFSGRVYRINNPSVLIFRSGGATHRVVDGDGVVHCVPAPNGESNDCVLRWKPRAGTNPVAF